jgi:hypothetical protein
MGRAPLILSVIFVFLGVLYSVKTYDSYLLYKDLVRYNSSMPMTSAAATFLEKTFSFSSEAYAGNATIRTPKSQVEPPQRGTKEFKTYEEFQDYTLTALLCYFCGYTTLYVTSRLAFKWQGSSI